MSNQELINIKKHSTRTTIISPCFFFKWIVFLIADAPVIFMSTSKQIRRWHKKILHHAASLTNGYVHFHHPLGVEDREGSCQSLRPAESAAVTASLLSDQPH